VYIRQRTLDTAFCKGLRGLSQRRTTAAANIGIR